MIDRPTRRTVKGVTFEVPVVVQTWPAKPGFVPIRWDYRLREYHNPETTTIGPRPAHYTSRPYNPGMEDYYRPKVERVLRAVAPLGMHVEDLCQAITGWRRCHLYTQVAVYHAARSLVEEGKAEVIEQEEWHYGLPASRFGAKVLQKSLRMKFRKVRPTPVPPGWPKLPPGAGPLARANMRMRKSMQDAKSKTQEKPPHFD